MIIDAHTHVGVRTDIDYMDVSHSPEDQIKLMDECGIDRAVIMLYADPPGTHEGYRRANDRAAEIARNYPRLTGFAQVDPRHPSALEELERAVKKLGLKGVKLYPNHWMFADHPIVFPVVEAAIKLDVPVMIHSDWNNKFATPNKVVRVARLFPEATIIMAHMGRYDPDLIHFIPDVAKEAENVVLECSCTTEHTYLYKKICDLLGAERLVFGSNSPMYHPLLVLRKLKLAGLSREEESLVLGGNIARILKIE